MSRHQASNSNPHLLQIVLLADELGRLLGDWLEDQKDSHLQETILAITEIRRESFLSLLLLSSSPLTHTGESQPSQTSTPQEPEPPRTELLDQLETSVQQAHWRKLRKKMKEERAARLDQMLEEAGLLAKEPEPHRIGPEEWSQLSEKYPWEVPTVFVGMADTSMKPQHDSTDAQLEQ